MLENWRPRSWASQQSSSLLSSLRSTSRMRRQRRLHCICKQPPRALVQELAMVGAVDAGGWQQVAEEANGRARVAEEKVESMDRLMQEQEHRIEELRGDL